MASDDCKYYWCSKCSEPVVLKGRDSVCPYCDQNEYIQDIYQFSDTNPPPTPHQDEAVDLGDDDEDDHSLPRATESTEHLPDEGESSEKKEPDGNAPSSSRSNVRSRNRLSSILPRLCRR